MKTKRKTPEIRFRGFTDDWEQRKLGDFGSVEMNRRIFKNETSESGDIPFYKIGTFGAIPDAYITRELFENYKDKYPYPEVGDILISASGSIGRTVVYTGEDEYFQDSNIVWLNHNGTLNNEFLNQFYQIVKWEGLEGSTIKRLYNKNILATSINAPKLEEQSKIGLFFKNIDNTITLHQRKLQQLKEVKRGMLLKMFPIGNTKTPSLRFLSFKNEWKNQKLKEVANRFDNLRVPVTASDRIAGTTPYYGANGIQDYVEGYTHNGEYILVAEDGANDLRNYPVHYANGKIWVNNHAHVIQAKKNISNNRFLQYSFSTLNIEPFLVGGSRAKLNSDIMMNLILKVPSIEEQEEIGKFIQKLDQLIELQEREIELLEETKKGFLQKMFV